MRPCMLGLVVVLGCSMVTSEASAQNFNDPFFAYYSFYLPRQQAQALQPGPEATINAFAANRQQYAATNRNGMFDPNSQGSDSSDFGDDFNGGVRRSKRSGGAVGYGTHGGNLNGLGPQGYYSPNLNKYYPGIKSGRGKNTNLAPSSTRRGRAGGAQAYSGLNSGLPGPR